MPDDQNEDRPPYLSLTTLLNFFERWGDGPIPPRIDKSALDRYSGGTQAMLMSTLRQIGYINNEGVVRPSLRDAINDLAARKAFLERWARSFYAGQLDLAEQNATAQMLQESFAQYGYSGSTLRKAIVFYLALVDYLDLPSSPHFRAPKQGATPTSRRRRSLPLRPEAPAPAPAVSRGDTTVVKVGDLATITVTVDAHWMKLPIETITKMRQAIATLEALNTADHP